MVVCNLDLFWVCIIGDFFHWIQFDPFWMKEQEVTQIFKFSWIGKGEKKMF